MNSNDKVLVLKDKYSTRIFRASTEEELNQSSLKILQSKVDSGYIINPEEVDKDMEELFAPKPPTFTQEQLSKLPDGAVKQAAIKEIQRYNEHLSEQKENERLWNKVSAALQNRDGKAAYRIIMSRNDYEYEGLSFIELE